MVKSVWQMSFLIVAVVVAGFETTLPMIGGLPSDHFTTASAWKCLMIISIYLPDEKYMKKYFCHCS